MTRMRPPGTVRWACVVACCCCGPLLSAQARDGGDIVVLRAAKVYIGDGRVLEGAGVVIRGGKIAAVGPDVAVPEGATVIDLPGGSITPGLIDANAWIEPTDTVAPPPPDAHTLVETLFHGDHHEHRGMACCGSTCARAYLHADGQVCPFCGFPNTVPAVAVGVRTAAVHAEQSSEVVPHTRVIDTVNLRSPDFARLARGGVTTVYVSPDTAAVISARGAVVRTGGPMSTRIIREADAVQAAMGADPSMRGMPNRMPFGKSVTFNTRRPTTRMGVTWVFRKALYDARRAASGQAIHGADAPSAQALEALNGVLRGEIPLRIQGRTQNDIVAALRLSEEFDVPFILEEATEAYLCLDELKARNIPVVFGPIYIDARGFRSMVGETNRNRLSTFKDLLDAGIATALTAHDMRDESGLARQAMYAMRNGLTLEQVLPALTVNPAKLLGIEDRVGTIAVGKQGDVVAWSGEPFAATSMPEAVLIGGEVVVGCPGK